LGTQLRTRRKALRLSSKAATEAAGMSRVTLLDLAMMDLRLPLLCMALAKDPRPAHVAENRLSSSS
jgi:hypothetical protein